jgi:hypothetical protein
MKRSWRGTHEARLMARMLPAEWNRYVIEVTDARWLRHVG